MVDINVVTENSFVYSFTIFVWYVIDYMSHIFRGVEMGIWYGGKEGSRGSWLTLVLCTLFDDYKLMFLRTYPLCFPQSNFFAALDDSDNEGKAPPAPVIATKKTKAAPPPKPEVVEPSKVVDRRPYVFVYIVYCLNDITV
jgi:hypothetical protein